MLGVCLCSLYLDGYQGCRSRCLRRYQRRSRTVQEKPGILLGTDEPNYGRTVDIVTRAALKEMVIPVFRSYHADRCRTHLPLVVPCTRRCSMQWQRRLAQPIHRISCFGW